MAKIHRYIQMSMQRSQFFAVFLRTRCNRNTGSATKLDNFIEASQCDHIGQFIGFWGNLLKPLATINLPKSSSFFGNFCKGVKIYHFPSKIILGQLLQTFGNFVLVTLTAAFVLSSQILCRKIVEYNDHEGKERVPQNIPGNDY